MLAALLFFKKTHCVGYGDMDEDTPLVSFEQTQRTTTLPPNPQRYSKINRVKAEERYRVPSWNIKRRQREDERDRERYHMMDISLASLG